MQKKPPPVCGGKSRLAAGGPAVRESRRTACRTTFPAGIAVSDEQSCRNQYLQLLSEKTFGGLSI